mmetsp:Transcript_60365/g.168677  ORF Transcript_60365/g.168677 Transcript_60365/m.168677 type:complete len:257 (+) Transcript_60365:305-1075(+)
MQVRATCGCRDCTGAKDEAATAERDDYAGHGEELQQEGVRLHYVLGRVGVPGHTLHARECELAPLQPRHARRACVVRNLSDARRQAYGEEHPALWRVPERQLPFPRAQRWWFRRQIRQCCRERRHEPRVDLHTLPGTQLREALRVLQVQDASPFERVRRSAARPHAGVRTSPAHVLATRRRQSHSRVSVVRKGRRKPQKHLSAESETEKAGERQLFEQQFFEKQEEKGEKTEETTLQKPQLQQRKLQEGSFEEPFE